MSAEIKLNLGCGISGISGWHNIDNSPTILLSRIGLARQLFRLPAWPSDVRRVDVLRGLPFSSETVACIYSSHLLQGLTYAESLALMKEAWRVLRPGGVLRIVVPDLGKVVTNYLSDPDPLASHKLLSRLSLKGSALRDLLRKGRRYEQMFDARSLLHLFVDAGFTNPEVRRFKESRIPEITAIELEQRKWESLYIEACKSPNDLAQGFLPSGIVEVGVVAGQQIFRADSEQVTMATTKTTASPSTAQA